MYYYNPQTPVEEPEIAPIEPQTPPIENKKYTGLRLYGDSRFDTAISIAKNYTGNSAFKNVVLATASNFPEA